MDTSNQLDAIFGALSNSTRRAIIARLSKGEASVNTLAKPFDMSLPAISKHIRVLEEAGLVERGRDAQYRPCKLAPNALVKIDNWTAQYRHIWEQRFDVMDQELQKLRGHKR